MHTQRVLWDFAKVALDGGEVVVVVAGVVGAAVAGVAVAAALKVEGWAES